MKYLRTIKRVTKSDWIENVEVRERIKYGSDPRIYTTKTAELMGTLTKNGRNKIGTKDMGD